MLVSISVTGAAVRLFGPLNIGWLRAIEMAVGFSTIYAFIGLALRTDRINWTKATTWESGRLWVSWLITTGTILGVHRYLGYTSLRVFGVILVASLFALSGIIFVRYSRRLIDGLFSRILTYHWRSPTTRERVIIVGSGRTAEHISWLMDHPTYSGKFQVVGLIDDDLRSQGMRIYGSKVIGRTCEIRAIVQKHDVGLIILTDHQTASHKYDEFRELANFKPARVVVAPDIFGSLGGLGNGLASDPVIRDLNDFQCQHCLARYAALKNSDADLPPAQQST
jgi:FlaA1/EpsC-like NDP-sugar epimerase